MTIYHKHHIIPRHMGGTDDPSNIIKLTVAEHAEAHKRLYEKYGKVEDKWAWKGLEGLIEKKDISSEIGRRKLKEITQTKIPCKNCERLISKHNMSRHLYSCTNGKEGVKANSTRKGLTMTKWGHNKTRIITDGSTTKRIPENDPVPEGWRYGRHYKPK